MDSQLARPASDVDSNRLQFQRIIEKKHDISFENYSQFHQWSIENSLDFWQEVWEYADVICSKPYTEIIDDKKFEDVPEWFKGARLNYTENLLRYPDDELALILSGENYAAPTNITYGDLSREVSTLSSTLRKAGAEVGDIIACNLSNRKEAVIVALAAASIGALLTSANSLMGPQAILGRFQQISPKFLFSIYQHTYSREDRNVLESLKQIVHGLPSLKKVIVIPPSNHSSSFDTSVIPNSILYADFFKSGLLQDGSAPKPSYEQLPFSHPLSISYTSGTTGPPKGMVHSAGCILLEPMKCLKLHMNMKSTDIQLTMFSTGWMTWQFFLTGLALGSKILLFEGNAFDCEHATFWDLIDHFNVTTIFYPPSYIDKLRKDSSQPPCETNSLKSLHTIIAGGCHIKAKYYDTIDEKVKRGVFFSQVYGSTELMSMFSGPDINLPVYKGEVQALSLGADICCYDDDGNRVVDKLGELVLAKPFPSIPLYFWNDPERKKYKSAFFEYFPGVWRHGDVGMVNSKTGGLIVLGRSDETIKQRSTRFGSSEIYAVVGEFDTILDSLCVSYTVKGSFDIAVLLLKIRDGNTDISDLTNTLKKEIAMQLTPLHVPDVMLQVQDIPYNLNGKKMEIFVKKLLSGQDVPIGNVMNLECLHEYTNVILPKLKQMTSTMNA